MDSCNSHNTPVGGTVMVPLYNEHPVVESLAQGHPAGEHQSQAPSPGPRFTRRNMQISTYAHLSTTSGDPHLIPCGMSPGSPFTDDNNEVLRGRLARGWVIGLLMSPGQGVDTPLPRSAAARAE